MKGNREPPAAGEGFHHPSTSLSRCWKYSSRLCRETGRDICRSERGIDGQNGERDFLTFITLSLLRKGRSLFLSGKEKGRGETILSFHPPKAEQDRAAV